MVKYKLNTICYKRSVKGGKQMGKRTFEDVKNYGNRKGNVPY